MPQSVLGKQEMTDKIPEMVERVARAIMAGLKDDLGGYYCYDSCAVRCSTLDGTFDLYDLARAAIGAMRKPTEKILDLIHEETADPCWRENALKAWQAGIDGALK